MMSFGFCDLWSCKGTGLGSSHLLVHDVCLLVSVICGHARHCMGSSHVLIHDVSCVSLFV